LIKWLILQQLLQIHRPIKAQGVVLDEEAEVEEEAEVALVEKAAVEAEDQREAKRMRFQAGCLSPSLVVL
jgi:hypothetical protein